MKKIQSALILGCSALALAGCDASEIVSPGTSGDIIINNGGGDSGGGSSGETGDVTPAESCPSIAATGGLTNLGTITGPTGTYRVCQLPQLIDADTTLTRIDGLLYTVNGRVDVGEDGGPTADNSDGKTDSDVTLTVNPGVVVFGYDGASVLIVNRGSDIYAVGEETKPIIFTSKDNVTGDSTDDSDREWGSIVLLGRAPVSDCASGNYNDGSGAFDQSTCEQELEGVGTTTLFGGNDSTDSSGVMKYVQIRFSGYPLSDGKELQSLTTGGIGSGTEIDHFMSFNSLDDGVEFFGGTVNMKNVVIVGAGDDSLDVDTGAQANLQYVIVAQRPEIGDNMIELDSPAEDYATDALPQTNLKVANFTFIQNSTASSQMIRMRGGAKATLVNGVLDTEDSICLRIDEAVTIAADPEFESIVGDCNATQPFKGGTNDVDDADVKAEWEAGSNMDYAFSITLTDMFVNGSNEGGVTAYDANLLGSFFDTTSFIGAVEDSSDTWYQGWTCDSSIVSFGNNVGDCTSIPIY